LRGVGAELDGGLIGGLAEVSEKVADLFLAAVDDLAGRSGVDGVGHILTKLLEAAPQLIQQGVCRQNRCGWHGVLLLGKRTDKAHSCAAVLSSQCRRSRKICHTRKNDQSPFLLLDSPVVGLVRVIGCGAAGMELCPSGAFGVEGQG